jgi:hypothetical protein
LTDLDLLHFEQLKTKVQEEYLKNNTPSDDNISKWKGIDIIYFQEDLRKKAKGNISEKSFYTYFKTSPVAKLPRIDMLNILSIYAGYNSWYEFKKQNLFAGELLAENEENDVDLEKILEELPSDNIISEEKPKEVQKIEFKKEENTDLQNSESENQVVKQESKANDFQKNPTDNGPKKSTNFVKRHAWLLISTILATFLGGMAIKNEFFDQPYVYCFKDADRNSPIQTELEIKVIKEKESPIFYRIKAGECFTYATKDKILSMEISSPVYENLKITRNLENASKEETIELNPDDYKMALQYFSTKGIKGDEEEQSAQLTQKRKQLEYRISDKAEIYQVFDNEIYGLETLDKQRYINLVTTPTTSLKNLNYIEIKKDPKNGKIVLIKFKITNHAQNN